jgi:hypothetical protein
MVREVENLKMKGVNDIGLDSEDEKETPRFENDEQNLSQEENKIEWHK